MLQTNSTWWGLVLVVLAAGCGSDDKECTTEAVFGLKVTVEDMQGAPVCDVTVRIQDGTYEEQSTLDLGNCVFHGAVERAGTYDISVLRDEAELARQTAVVPAGECHIVAQAVTIVLDE